MGGWASCEWRPASTGLRQAHRVYEQVHQPLIVGGMSLLWGLSRRRKRAKELLVELEAMACTGYVPPSAFAMAYIGLGDDRAFEWLEKAIDGRDPIVTHLPSMPLYDGLRGDPRWAHLRVIAVSGFARWTDFQRTREAGFDGHVSKPFDTPTLLAALRQVLDQGPRGQPAA